jgi:6,7-dimethyl-8-ribityllumazine synthase
MSSGGFWPGDPSPADEEDSGLRVPGWPAPRPEIEATDVDPSAAVVEEPEPEPEPEPAESEPAEPELAEPEPVAAHVPGELDIPDGVGVLEGSPSGAERTVGIVVSRFNGEITNRLLESALGALDDAGVAKERITVMPVPGAFELPIGAMALAKTRRYSCVIALGCVVRGETPHFDFVATEAASGLQLAGLETGVPVAFGVLTVETVEQATARTGKGAEAARTALEMADLFAQVRARAKSAG